jgi:hypothetical protein
MGSYTDNLFRRRRAPKAAFSGERLTDVAIIRDGEVYFGGKSHAQIRAKIGDDNIYASKPGDVEGFMTSARRFVDRNEAKLIGERAGQCRPMARTLLSSDIDW